MTYPSTWLPGEILGRNYVPHPKFTDGVAATAAALWTGGVTDTRDLGAANGGTQFRLGGFSLATTVLPMTFAEAAGKTYIVRVLSYATDAASSVAVVGGGSSVTTVPASAYVALPQTAGYVWHEITVICPDTGYKNSLGNPATPTEVQLQFKSTNANQLGIARVRVDEPGSAIAGYLDGDGPDTASWDYAWTGTALRSSSTATALTQYPVPVVQPNDPPLARFTASSTDLTVSVDASASSDPEGTAVTFAWTFGDGGTATGPTASHTYAADGTYTVTLTATDEAGNVATATKTAAVSLVQDTDPDEPTPTPEPVSALIADVVAFMGRTGDPGLEALAVQHVPVMAELINAYVRGNGPVRTGLALGEFTFPPDLRAVVLTASARLLANPAQLESESADGYAARGAFTSFSLAEHAVLHRYRRRVA